VRALVFQDGLQFRTDYPLPRPGYNEALIRVLVAGICGTDLEVIRGYMTFHGVPGHEFVGVVEECGEEGLQGKRVVGEINLGCGVCAYCLKRMRNHCPNRSVLGILNKDGAFADYLTLPVRNLRPVPETVTEEEAVFVEPLAAAFEIIQQVSIRPQDRVCVLGDGRLGLLVGLVLSLTGCSLSVVGKHETKLAILEKRRIPVFMQSNFAEKEFDIVVDCTGSGSGFETARQLVRPRGTLVLKSTVAQRNGVDLNSLVIDEITVVGSRCGDFGSALRALNEGTVDVTPMISRSFPLEEGIKAFDYAASPGVLKVILKML